MVHAPGRERWRFFASLRKGGDLTPPAVRPRWCGTRQQCSCPLAGQRPGDEARDVDRGGWDRGGENDVRRIS